MPMTLNDRTEDTRMTDAHFGLYLADDKDGLRFVPDASLAAMIEDAAPGARVAVLDGCHGDPLADAVLRAVGCVVAMPGRIDDEAVASFSPAFHRTLGNGRSVGTAFDQAVATLASLPDEQLPKLRWRDGVNPYQLYLRRGARTPEWLPRAVLGTGETASRQPAPTLRIGLIVAVIALMLFAVGAAAATFWIHETERPTAQSSSPAPAPLRADASRLAREPASPEALLPAPDAKRPPTAPPLAVAGGALQGRAPEPAASAGPPRQQLTAPTTDVSRSAPPIATAADRARAPYELGKQTVRRFVLREIDQLRGCYEDQLRIAPTLSGIVVAQFLVGPGGVVTASSARGLGDAVDFCVAGVLRDIRFPSSESSVLVRYPLHFQLAKPRPGARATPTIGVDVPVVQRAPIGPGGP
jgi:hypothetical protein